MATQCVINRISLLTPYHLYYIIALVSGRAPSLNGRAYALLGLAVETPLIEDSLATQRYT